MQTLSARLTDLVTAAAVAAGYEGVVAVESAVPTNDPQHGHYQSNHAFRLGKALRKNPRQVADEIKAKNPENDLLASVAVAGPGFVNMTLRDDAIGRDVVERALDPRLGTPQSGAGRTMVVDYSSPNVAKRMHVGHLRSTVIGNAIDRLHRYIGWNVVADNHIGDWGTPFGKLIVMWDDGRDEAAFAADPIGELQRLYQGFSAREKEDPSLIERARAEVAKLQKGDPRNFALWDRFVSESMREFDGVYQRLGVKFDVVHGESFYRDELDALVADLVKRGFAEESEGALVMRFPEDPSLADHPMLVRKRDGAAMYATTDLATARHRVMTWSPARIVIVTDIRQRLHFDQVFAGARKVGFVPPEVELVHIGFGMLKLPSGQIVATRAAPTSGGDSREGSLNLVDVFDTAVMYARKVVDEKSAQLPDEERGHIAEAVGVGAIRYADLSQNPATDLTFEWDKILSLQGNTAPYLMYAYARCKSILRKSEIVDFAPAACAPAHAAERTLALKIARTAEVIEDAANSYRPSLLCTHLFELAGVFADFYRDCPVLKDDVPPEVRASRLSLVYATARAMSEGMQLVGLVPLERM
jgi:arginyl-tRNA synthetase